jgi:hypothetical protein
MSIQRGMIYNDKIITEDTISESPGSGELLRSMHNAVTATILGRHGDSVLRVTHGDCFILRDSKPTPMPVETLLGSLLFNNQIQAIYTSENSIVDIRHGDMLAMFNGFSSVTRVFGNRCPERLRVFIFVDENVSHVQRVLCDRDIMIGFRNRFDRFISNLWAEEIEYTYSEVVRIYLNTDNNDAELKEIRKRIFIMVLHKRCQLRFDASIVRNIINRL